MAATLPLQAARYTCIQGLQQVPASADAVPSSNATWHTQQQQQNADLHFSAVINVKRLLHPAAPVAEPCASIQAINMLGPSPA